MFSRQNRVHGHILDYWCWFQIPADRAWLHFCLIADWLLALTDTPRHCHPTKCSITNVRMYVVISTILLRIGFTHPERSYYQTPGKLTTRRTFLETPKNVSGPKNYFTCTRFITRNSISNIVSNRFRKQAIKLRNTLG